jgi:hypothetical protein
MHVRDLSWILSVLSLTACAPQPEAGRVDATPGYLVHGELPRGVAIEDVLLRIPRRGFGVVGDPSTGELATIVPTPAHSPEIVSDHFQVTTPASCTNCFGCPATTREIAIGLTQVSGPEDLPLRVQTHSSTNFSAPMVSPSSWISAVSSEVTISTVGTVSACAPFSYYFDIAECGAEDDCIECSSEDTRDVSCGVNGNGTQSQVCFDGAWQDDGPCDDPDTCQNGIYFSEGFSDNSKGWTLEGEWGIGPTAASDGQQQGNGDPASDVSASDDNGVAGIVLGGNYSQQPGGPYYLTSPMIDLSAVSGTVHLRFWRWLNCDSQPWGTATVQVWNGSTWVVLWQNSVNTLTTDNAWYHQVFDVTSFKNAEFRVRFSHQTETHQMLLPWIMSGWNIDDLSLSNGYYCD